MALADWLATPATFATSATGWGVTGPSVANVANVASPADAAPVRLSQMSQMSQASPEQAAELRALIWKLGADWPDGEREEALAIALADPVDALTCYRHLVADMPALAESYGLYTTVPIARRRPDDNRRLCEECANLTPKARCLAAWRGELFGVPRNYEPMAGILGRCECFAPRPDDPDQRPAVERWPYIIADANRRRQEAKEWGRHG